MFVVDIHLIPWHGGLLLLLVWVGFEVFLHFIVLEDGTDQSLAKLRCLNHQDMESDFRLSLAFQ